MGTDITDVCLDFLKNKWLPPNQNNTNIVLIPKKPNSEFMSDFQPISLCNVLYKVVSKFLSNRLRSILPDIISNEQSNFFKNWLITDNVLVALEVAHFLKRKT